MSSTFKIEVERHQTQTIEVQAESLEEALKIIDQRSFIFPPDLWETTDYNYMVPLNEDGEYDPESIDWVEQ